MRRPAASGQRSEVSRQRSGVSHHRPAPAVNASGNDLKQTGRGSAVHDFCTTVRIEFFGSILKVKLHSTFADEDFMSDLFIAHTLSRSLNHFEFTIGEVLSLPTS